MATTTTTATTPLPPQTYNIPQNHMGYYGANGQYSPSSSVSPESPRADPQGPYNPNPRKQLRPLKSPLYVPAVFRPTTFSNTSPSTPPDSARNSLNHVEDKNTTAIQNTDYDTYMNLIVQGHEGTEIGDVTGPPTHEHWRPDEASPSCDSPQCKTNFNLFVRKHHCRHCGHIFCSTHSSQFIPLDQAARFHPDGYQSRACDTCHKQYQKWDTARSLRRKNSDDTASSNDSQSYKSIPTQHQGHGHRRMQSAAIPTSGGQPQQQQPIASSMANSVPKDWAWSTF